MEGEDRNSSFRTNWVCKSVALRMEGEDRNLGDVRPRRELRVALRMEGEDRNWNELAVNGAIAVALRMEGEDRNGAAMDAGDGKLPSPSVWRARIETIGLSSPRSCALVALRMEGEDRNVKNRYRCCGAAVALRMEGEDRNYNVSKRGEKMLSSPSVWRARIETSHCNLLHPPTYRRPPYGGRG